MTHLSVLHGRSSGLDGLEYDTTRDTSVLEATAAASRQNNVRKRSKNHWGECSVLFVVECLIDVGAGGLVHRHGI